MAVSIISKTTNDGTIIGNELHAFIQTGSAEPPVVSLAENPHNPSVQTMYAVAGQDRDDLGVFLKIQFDGHPTQTGMTVHIAQEGIVHKNPTVRGLVIR
ncbi:hypothetical protein [Bacillus cereus]|uniref:hypothetical protein n=1 Tax=Bacillus cereus TaxID=1396 RepID=UPI000B4AA37C|nr:hypothetical protein [Bacillus cereus]